jgi:hypothetical protein
VREGNCAPSGVPVGAPSVWISAGCLWLSVYMKPEVRESIPKTLPLLAIHEKSRL